MGVSVKPKRRSGAAAAIGAGPGGGASIEILGMEIVQVVQTLANEVPLIRGKSTVVRVYFNPNGFATTTKIQGEIAVAPSPGAPAKYVGSTNVLSVPNAKFPDLAAQRGDIRGSLNFILPDEITKWTSVSVRLNRVLASGGDIAIEGDQSVTRALEDAPVLRVKAIGLRYVWTKPDGTVANVSPEAFQFDFLRSFLSRAYPVSAVEWSQFVVQANPLFSPPFSGQTTPDGFDPVWSSKLDLAHNQLSAIRAKDIDAGTDPRTHYYGIVSDA
jgi:hypothetical protein